LSTFRGSFGFHEEKLTDEFNSNLKVVVNGIKLLFGLREIVGILEQFFVCVLEEFIDVVE
jgi:hypothetical protein